MRLLVFDATRRRDWLSLSWRAGSHVYRALGIDAACAATSWHQALVWLSVVHPGRAIDEVQFWGHGKWGRALIGDDVLDLRSTEPGHALHAPLAAVRARLAGPDALWWWRTCETFGAQPGQEFATAWTSFLGCRSAGHTFVINVWQSGLHELSAGAVPQWSADEGLLAGTPEHPVRARWSHPFAPSTVHFMTSRLPRRA
jgi:hypothetical protein